MLLPDSDSLFVVVTANALGRCRWHIALGSVVVAALSDRSISCLPGTWQPRCALLRIDCVGRRASASARMRTDRSFKLQRRGGPNGRKAEAEVRLQHGDRSTPHSSPHKSPGYVKNKSSFHQRFRRLARHSPARSGVFLTRASSRTPISAFPRRDRRLRPIRPRRGTTRSRGESSRMARSVQGADGGRL
jgi:hypothetical protein